VILTQTKMADIEIHSEEDFEADEEGDSTYCILCVSASCYLFESCGSKLHTYPGNSVTVVGKMRPVRLRLVRLPHG